MLVRHIHNQKSLEKEVTSPVAPFLRSSQGWFSQFTERQSRYEGWFLGDSGHLPHQYFKILERITLAGHTTPSELHIRTTAARFVWPDTAFDVVPAVHTGGGAGLSFISDQALPYQLTLDMRGIYATPDMERLYRVEEGDQGIWIHYTDPGLATPLFLHIRGDITARSIVGAQWKEVFYSRDAARHSSPDHRYVYELPTLLTKRLDLGSGFSKETAAEASLAASHMLPPSFTSSSTATPEEMAKHTVERSLQFLRTADGYYAGFPWFHQFWSRDELITGLGLPEDEQRTLIERYLKLPLQNGELPTYIGSGTTCADGVGWLALVIKEYGIEKFKGEDQKKLESFLIKAYQDLHHSRQSPSGLIWSGHNATWMDTIGRAGFRLEIQCMYALVAELLATLTGANRYREDHKQALQTIRHYFFTDSYLLDGMDDQMNQDTYVRPNMFLAYVLQPNLLQNEEWSQCFTRGLQALEMPWGGLASLDKTAPAFQAVSTGEDNKSYHQGDSWFFVNGLAALALRRLGNPLFKATADKLVASSTEEILWQHFLGMHGEIASASNGESWGCGIQGFSGGAYLKALAG